jgi:hypothetical protein
MRFFRNHHNHRDKKQVNLDKHPGISICSAHPLYSAEERISYNVGSTFLTGMKYHVMKTVDKGVLSQPTNGNCSANLILNRNDQLICCSSVRSDQSSVLANASTLCSIGSSYKGSLAYSHSFCMSTNYVVLIEQPFLVNGLRLMTCTPKGKSMQECIEWFPNEPTRFHVIRKSDGSVISTKFVSSALFFLHTINAFEQDDQLILDLIIYNDPSIFECLRMETLRKGEYDSKAPPTPMRFVLPLTDVKVSAAKDKQ